jgi:hypothetical protein
LSKEETREKGNKITQRDMKGYDKKKQAVGD